jgi:hypothetical protein
MLHEVLSRRAGGAEDVSAGPRSGGHGGGGQATVVWHARIAKLKFGLVALAITFAGIPVLLETVELRTPVATWASLIAAVVSGLSAVVTQVIGRAGPMLREHPKFVFWVLVGVNVIFLGIAAIAVITQVEEGWLDPRVPLDVDLAAGEQQILRFEVEPGQSVIIRLRASEPGVEITASVRRDERDEVVRQTGDRGWEHRAVLDGGRWDLVINNDDQVDARVRARYDPVGRRLSLTPGQSHTVDLASGALHGYTFRPEEGQQRLMIEPLESPSEGELQLDIRAWAETGRTGVVRQLADGRYELELSQHGTDHVMAIRALDDDTGRYRVSYPRPSERVVLPPLYEVQESEAFERLRDAGIEDVEAIRVCSGSVDEGRVRQAFILDGSEREVVVADEPDVVVPGVRVEAGETVWLKISTGRPCE